MGRYCILSREPPCYLPPRGGVRSATPLSVYTRRQSRPVLSPLSNSPTPLLGTARCRQGKSHPQSVGRVQGPRGITSDIDKRRLPPRAAGEVAAMRRAGCSGDMSEPQRGLFASRRAMTVTTIAFLPVLRMQKARLVPASLPTYRRTERGRRGGKG